MKFEISSKSFAGKQVLGPISFEPALGHITALIGASGIGKTTLLRILARLDRDDTGTLQPEYKIGFVFQEPRLLPWKTVRENIDMAGAEGALLTDLNLADTENLYPRQLSLGMARRVAIARALAYRPQFLILDEPFASLDVSTAAIVRNIVKAAAANPEMATLLVTHDQQEAAELASQVFVLEGRPSVSYTHLTLPTIYSV